MAHQLYQLLYLKWDKVQGILLVPECLDRAEFRRLSRRIDPEEKSDAAGKCRGDQDHEQADVCLKADSGTDADSPSDSDNNSQDSAHHRDNRRLHQKLQHNRWGSRSEGLSDTDLSGTLRHRH